MSASIGDTPIVSKIYCSPRLTTLTVRKRPRVVNGGGFVVAADCSRGAAFSVDGCGVLGTKGEMIVRDGDGGSILQIRKKGGVVQALVARGRWKGYLADDGGGDGPSKLVFTLSEPRTMCVAAASSDVYRICIEPKGNNRDWDFEVKGSFFERACTISDRRGNVVAQVGATEIVGSNDFYAVAVQPGFDQAFVVAVVAILDNIHGESTRC